MMMIPIRTTMRTRTNMIADGYASRCASLVGYRSRKTATCASPLVWQHHFCALGFLRVGCCIPLPGNDGDGRVSDERKSARLLVRYVERDSRFFLSSTSLLVYASMDLESLSKKSTARLGLGSLMRTSLLGNGSIK